MGGFNKLYFSSKLVKESQKRILWLFKCTLQTSWKHFHLTKRIYRTVARWFWVEWSSGLSPRALLDSAQNLFSMPGSAMKVCSTRMEHVRRQNWCLGGGKLVLLLIHASHKRPAGNAFWGCIHRVSSTSGVTFLPDEPHRQSQTVYSAFLRVLNAKMFFHTSTRERENSRRARLLATSARASEREHRFRTGFN